MKASKEIAVIHWTDSANHAIGWEWKVKANLASIVTIGFISHQNKKCVTLVQSVCVKGSGKGSANNAITIPRGCITKIQIVPLTTEIKS